VKRLVCTAIFFLTLLVCAPGADAAPVSRYDLLEKACRTFWDRTPDEAAVLRSDLLKPFPDGRIHLDWPATRGTALLVLYELLGPATAFATPAATFTDIAAGSGGFVIHGASAGDSRSVQASASADSSSTESTTCGSVFAGRRPTQAAPRSAPSPRAKKPAKDRATADWCSSLSRA